MTFDILKDQRMKRTIFYSLIQAANLLVENNKNSEIFNNQIEKFLQEKVLFNEEIEPKEKITELLDTFGWRHIVFEYNEESMKGSIKLGKNKYILSEIADSKGALIVIKALIEGICYQINKTPVEAEVHYSLSAGVQYDITFGPKKILTAEDIIRIKKSSKYLDNDSMHEEFTIENLYSPIFSKEISPKILFEITWKVITESFVANVSGVEDEEVKKAIKNESMKSLSILIQELSEDESEEEIYNISEIIGEYIVKILKTRYKESLVEKLQTTLQDRNADNYLIYFDCRSFCAERNFDNRCLFIRGLWVGILSEIYGKTLKIKEVLHAGKRDRYCMIEILPK